MEFVLRAGREDHRVLAELTAPAAAGLRLAQAVPLSAVVSDAPVALERAQIRESAEAAGVPYLVDPMTFLLADRQAPDQAWARLPFAIPDRLRAADLNNADMQDELIDRVIEFQRRHGATMLIPPYLYLPRLDDDWLTVQLSLLRRTAHYLESRQIGLPVAPIIAASLRQFGTKASWRLGVDRLISACADLNTRFVGLSLSWNKQGDDSIDTLTALLSTTQHAANQARVVGWRQGLYGAAEVAVGAVGYETGAAQYERSIYPSMMRNRRPRTALPEQQGGAGAYVYLQNFGRSIRRSEAAALFADPATKAAILCTDEDCCPNGATSMSIQWRQHAVRSRYAELVALDEMPAQATWRLNKVARDADRAADIARTANDVLLAAGVKRHLPEHSFTHLARSADAIRAQARASVA
jgi:hypothetical protein